MWVVPLVILIVLLPSPWAEKLSGCIYRKPKRRRVDPSSAYEEFLWSLQNGVITPLPDSSFKFYKNLFKDLITLFRTSGELNKEGLGSLMQSLDQDFRFDIKIKGIRKSSYAQFTLTTIFTWLFIVSGKILLEVDVNPLVIIGIVLLQVGGFILFFTFEKRVYNSLFGAVDQLLERMVLFRNYYQTPMSSREILKQSKITIFDDQVKLPCEFKVLYDRVIQLINDWKNLGHSIKDELGTYEGRLNFLRERQFENFCRSSKVLQFFTLCLFFLPSYFIFILSLFDAFLIE
ncbi:MAG: hypothetical protein KC493_06415 [Bacteriovoracaceae bacterium]|nr:hypothetical protein [Bacteriovoracaceae bacterium]